MKTTNQEKNVCCLFALITLSFVIKLYVLQLGVTLAFEAESCTLSCAFFKLIYELKHTFGYNLQQNKQPLFEVNSSESATM